MVSVPFVEQTFAQLTAGAVRAELARRRISGRELARGLGWSHNTTNRRLSGASPLDIDELVAVARHLGVPLSSLLPADEQVPA